MAVGHIKCPNCGGPVKIGLVFCNHCGSKLDLSGLSRDELRRTEPSKVGPWIVKGVIWAAVAGAVISVVLAFWPERSEFGAPGTRMGALRVERQLSTVGDLKSGQSLGIWLAEEDINAYFQFFGDERLQVQSLRFVLRGGQFEAKAVKQYGPYAAGPVRITPVFSVRVRFIPIGKHAVAVSGRLGHMPLPGFLVRRLASGMRSRFQGWPETSIERWLDNVTVESGRVELTFRK
ncbi:MAG: zinc ribbon domain-containing protein [Lentisphaerae bacterium]|nr:zinc ribbon domain-containing protein [Lentisphaerota bacterium]